MTEEEIKSKLIENGFENYIPLFEEHHLLDSSVLASMTNDDYVSIGISILGDRKKMILIFQNTEEENVPDIKNSEKENDLKEEFVNIVRNGKEFCYKNSDPGKMCCRKCHSVVAEESTLCWKCNNSLVASEPKNNIVYNSPMVNPSTTLNTKRKNKDDSSGKSVFKRFLIAIIISFVAMFILYYAIGKDDSSSLPTSKILMTGVEVSVSDVQLQIVIPRTLNNVRIRVNGDYIYEAPKLTEGTYTVGLASFADSKGNRFNPFFQKVQRVSVFSREGSTSFYTD